MIVRDDIIEIGRYNKPHGVNGEISATIDVDVEIVGQFSCLISEMDGIYVPFFVENKRAKSATTVLLTIDGIDNEHQASLLVNHDIFVLKKEYEAVSFNEDCDEMPIDYFIGFSILNQEQQFVGEIVDVDDSTENVLFVVEREDETEVSVPAADDLIQSIDVEAQQIVMFIPEGLLEL